MLWLFATWWILQISSAERVSTIGYIGLLSPQTKLLQSSPAVESSLLNSTEVTVTASDKGTETTILPIRNGEEKGETNLVVTNHVLNSTAMMVTAHGEGSETTILPIRNGEEKGKTNHVVTNHMLSSTAMMVTTHGKLDHVVTNQSIRERGSATSKTRYLDRQPTPNDILATTAPRESQSDGGWTSNSTGELAVHKIHGNGTALNKTVCLIFGMESSTISEKTCGRMKMIIYGTSAIFLPILIIGGTTGNLLSLAVMTRPAMRRYSTSVYTSALAIVDTVYLWGILPHCYFFWSNGDDSLHNILSGKLFYYVYYVCCNSSAWFVVAMSIDRFIVGYFPLKAASLCTIGRTKKIIAAIFISIMLICSYLPIFVKTNHVTESGVVPLFNNADVAYFYVEITPLLDLTFYICVPFIILVVTNTLLMKKIYQMRNIRIRKSNGKMVSHDSHTSNKESMSRTEIQMTFISILICAIFITCTLPVLIFSIIFLKFLGNFTPDEQIKILFGVSMVGALPYINSAVNFAMYCLTGTKFRRELHLMFSNGIQCRADSEQKNIQLQTVSGTLTDQCISKIHYTNSN